MDLRACGGWGEPPNQKYDVGEMIPEFMLPTATPERVPKRRRRRKPKTSDNVRKIFGWIRFIGVILVLILLGGITD